MHVYILDLCIPQFNRSWFKPEEASGLRQRIRELLLEEFESARLDHAISKADAPEGYDSIKDVGLEEDDSSKMVVEVGDAAKSIKGISVLQNQTKQVRSLETLVRLTNASRFWHPEKQVWSMDTKKVQ